jgi:hypothetical protein
MENTHTIKANIENYVEDKLDLVKLKAADKAGTAVSNMVVGLVVARLFLFVMIFLSFSAAYAISDLTERSYLGFLLVGGFYVLLAVLLILFREKMVTMPVINSLLKKLKYGEHKV